MQLLVSDQIPSLYRCVKLHVDHVHIRAICTYLGPGTEYGPSETVSIIAGRVAGPATEPLQHAATGDVLYLKGAREGAGDGAAHRSPDYDGTRLLLIVDTVLDELEYVFPAST